MSNPYENLNRNAFWKTAVVEPGAAGISGLWQPKFPINRKMPIATFGSCFAQHIGRNLRDRGYRWACTEPPPMGLSKENIERFGFNLFTCRTGNIYTAALLNQWVDWALGNKQPPDLAWEKDGRFFDPFRPTVEPNGFESFEEMIQLRNQTIASFRECIETSKIFVFTMGLTETWVDTRGYVYPACPGTAAGEFDSEVHLFENADFSSVKKDLLQAIAKMRAANRRLKILLTVSPVPITATNTDQHVLVAASGAKSILRTVAGEVNKSRNFVDYFPSYELITSHVFEGKYFGPNRRTVTLEGVDRVMQTFFGALENGDMGSTVPGDSKSTVLEEDNSTDDTTEDNCEDILLEAFAE